MTITKLTPKQNKLMSLYQKMQKAIEENRMEEYITLQQQLLEERGCVKC